MRNLAIAALFVSSAALAQVASVPPLGPDNGFFRPTPLNDPSLTRDPVLAAQQAAQQEAMIAAENSQPAPILVQPLLPDPATLTAEVQTDVARQEAEDERQRAQLQPKPIAGAFTGMTNERDR